MSEDLSMSPQEKIPGNVNSNEAFGNGGWILIDTGHMVIIEEINVMHLLGRGT